MLSAAGRGFVATGGLKKDATFFDISTQYKGQNTIVDLILGSHSSVSTKVTVKNPIPSAKTVISLKIPDLKSSKVNVQYVHPHATLKSSIGLNSLLDLSATIGSQNLCLGGKVRLDTASFSLTKFNVGIGFNKPHFSSALILKGESLRATYVHTVNPTTSFGAELSFGNNSFTIGSCHCVDPLTVVKTRFSSSGMVVRREWKPKSIITFSAEFDSKSLTSSPKIGLALALKPYQFGTQNKPLNFQQTAKNC